MNIVERDAPSILHVPIVGIVIRDVQVALLCRKALNFNVDDRVGERHPVCHGCAQTARKEKKAVADNSAPGQNGYGRMRSHIC